MSNPSINALESSDTFMDFILILLCEAAQREIPRLEQSTDSRRVRDRDPRAQPSEPILFPKLRIHFADFPCLHCSIDQRLFTLET